MVCKVGFTSTIGERDSNQDCGLAMRIALMGQECILLGVCDGMGGDTNGARAAAEVTRSLSGFLAFLPSEFFTESAFSDGEEGQSILNDSIINWHKDAQKRLENVAQETSLRGLTTTLAAAFIWSSRVDIWWLGDSRVYLFRDGRLVQLTRDHSVVQERLDLPEEEALEHEQNNQVTRFIRPHTTYEPAITSSDWQEGDVLLVVSDGISGACRHRELEATLAYHLAADISPSALCQGVLNLVSDNLHDNASIAVAINGTPKPFGQDIATVEWQEYTRQGGLRADLVHMLLEHMHQPREQQQGDRHPHWRQLFAQQQGSAPDYRIVNRDDYETLPVAICLTCGMRLDAHQECPTHGSNQVYEGWYLQVQAPDGHRSYYRLTDTFTIGTASHPHTHGQLRDAYVSFMHAQLSHVVNDERQFIAIQDLDSDNGVWLRIDKGQIYIDDNVRISIPVSRATTDKGQIRQDMVPDFIRLGMMLRIGKHIVHIRATKAIADTFLARVQPGTHDARTAPDADQIAGRSPQEAVPPEREPQDGSAAQQGTT